MSTHSTAPHTPPPGRDCPEALVAEHTLVRALPTQQLPDGLTRTAETLWRTLTDTAEPVTVLELALRRGLPVGVVKVLVNHLVDAHLAKTGAARFDPATLRAALGEHHGTTDGLATVKTVVAGSPGSGTTTLLGTLSTVPPVAVGERLPAPGGRVTTLMREWGRLPLAGGVTGILTAVDIHNGPRPAWWDDLGLWRGAAAAVVLAHPARLEEAHPAVDRLAEHGLPYTVGVNTFPATAPPDADQVRAVLRTDATTPVTPVDARDPESARALLCDALRHAARTGDTR